MNQYESAIPISGSKTDKKHKSKKSIGIDTEECGVLGLGIYDEMQHGGDEDMDIFSNSETVNAEKLKQVLKIGINQPSELGDPMNSAREDTIEEDDVNVD